jgi:alpha-amylase/alpha-mannosidase (GH57 family)
MKRYLCIHGHFYQPPRENPWLEAIEYQASAHPFHDWNERITAESYRPNSASRILGPEETIEEIANNYERISFNFGPTLLAWLQEFGPQTYERILEADRASRNHFDGHGSAIAQPYNHLIMPLANLRDKVTQVIWGLRDFETRFGRKPEGMWLPETAVDVETLEILSEHGIRFTILEPHQARRFRKLGEVEWIDAAHGGIDPTRAYSATLPSGRSIAIFFYDGPISRAIAFEDLLERGEYLVGRLEGAFRDERSWPQLVHIATDGETYGHHHRHGDMALAYALETIDRLESVQLTIYGEYLERHPPEWEVEIEENTAWSCAHGIERWRSDCGCQTGGGADWHQKWRRPLRDALDWLRDRANPLYEQAGGELLRDPWAARDAYIDVVLDRSDESIRRFMEQHRTRELSEDETVRALELLELQRHAMLMFTSCGWFFNDVSGIETVQVIQYAARVIQLGEKLFETPLEADFLDRLEAAESNVREYANGRRIYEGWIRPTVVDLQRVAAHYAVLSLFNAFEPVDEIYAYEVERLDHHSVSSGRSRLEAGHIRVTSRITREAKEFSYGVLYLGDLNVSGGVRNFRGAEPYAQLVRELTDPFGRGDYMGVIRALDQQLGSLTFSIKSIFRDEQRKILKAIWRNALSESEAVYRQLYDRFVPLMRFHNDIGIPFPRSMRLATELSINMQLRQEMEREVPDIGRVRNLLSDAQAGLVDLDDDTVGFPLEQRIEDLSRAFRHAPQSLSLIEELERLLDIADELPIEVDVWPAQTAWYYAMKDHGRAFDERADDGDEKAQDWLARFNRLGERLDIRARQQAERTPG